MIDWAELRNCVATVSSSKREPGWKMCNAMAMGFVPLSHRIFLRSLVAMYQAPELAFVHAGIRPGISLNEQQESDLVWIRRAFHNHPDPHPKLIVHGHTPVDRVTHHGHRINLDSGAGDDRAVGVVVLEGCTCWQLTDKGRMPLVP